MTSSDWQSWRVKELSRDDKPVATVVALSADDHYAMLGKRGEGFAKKIDDSRAGVLHQDDARNTGFDGEAVRLAHFGGRENVHVSWTPRASSSVMSSKSSAVPVQLRTASSTMPKNFAIGLLRVPFHQVH